MASLVWIIDGSLFARTILEITLRRLGIAREVLGPANVIEMPSPSMGSEDFAWFAERVPSAHLRIGSKIDGYDTAIHRADYQLNEQVIPVGMKVMTRAVLSLMG